VLFRNLETKPKEAEKAVCDAAMFHKDLSLFTFADPEEESDAKMFGFLGLNIEEVSLLVVVNLDKIKQKTKVYQFNDTTFTIEKVSKFITNWKNGLIKKRLREVSY